MKQNTKDSLINLKNHMEEVHKKIEEFWPEEEAKADPNGMERSDRIQVLAAIRQVGIRIKWATDR